MDRGKWLIALLAAAGAAAIALGEFGRSALFDSTGRIESGEKFGVRVGEPIQEAQRRLQSDGWRKVETAEDARRCGFIEMKSHDQTSYFQSSWTSGVVCVGHNGQRVSEVAWTFAAIEL